MHKVFCISTSWLPSVVYMGILSFLAGIPGDKLTLPAFFGSDKLLHFFSYLILGVLIYSRRIITRRLYSQSKLEFLFWPGLIVGIVHGMSNEFLQIYVPMRDFSYFDMLANCLGAVTGIFSGWFAKTTYDR
jgi:VanZ family protein